VVAVSGARRQRVPARGAACVRFRKVADLPLEVIGKAARRVPVKKFLAFYEETLAGTKRGKSAAAAQRAVAKKAKAAKKTVRKKGVRKVTAKKTAAKRITAAKVRSSL
jgi:di/tripeptidase